MGHERGRPTGPAALDAIVSAVVETRRQVAALQAHEARLLADAVDLAVARMAERPPLRPDRDMPLREIAAELGAAMRVPDRTVQSRMGDAVSLVERFPATLTAWEAGDVDAGHVSAIVDAGAAIGDDDVRSEFEGRMLAAAACETPGRLRPLARAVAATLDPRTVDDHRHGHAARRVRVIDLDDGMARLIADLPAPLAYAILDRLTQLGRHTLQHPTAPDASPGLTDGDRTVVVTGPTPAASSDAGSGSLPGGGPEAHAEPAAQPEPPTDAEREAGREPEPGSEPGSEPEPERQSESEPEPADPRTLDQVRADTLADLLLAGAPAAHGDGDALAAITGHIQVTVPVLTLAGAGSEPALLTGYGPIDAATARRLAGHATGWDRVLTHPYTGAVLAVDRYRPNADLDRFLRARDERCRAPGCTRPAVRCDVDHTVDHAHGGPTAADNLCHLCRRHHSLKHATAWAVRQLGGGVIEWTSPTGRRYADRPPATVRFVPADRLRTTPDDEPPPPF
ncbi:MAG: DUF222 domain-containing protein [Microbacterium sp.]